MKKTLFTLFILLVHISGKVQAQYNRVLKSNQFDYIGELPADFSLTVNYGGSNFAFGGLQFVLTQPTNLILYIPNAYQRDIRIQGNDDVVTTEYFDQNTDRMPQYTQGGPVTIQGINLQPGSYDLLAGCNEGSTLYITGIAVSRPAGDPEVLPMGEPTALANQAAIQLKNTMNYTAVVKPRSEVSSLEFSGGQLNNYAAAHASVSIKYYDGFFRPIQQIDYRVSPGGKDLVHFLEYTGWGRVGRQWLPAAFQTNGAYFQPSALKSRSRLSNNDQSPFSSGEYENSALNRKIAETGAGNAWHVAGRSNVSVLPSTYFIIEI